MQFARADYGIFARDHPALDMTNPVTDSEMNNEAEDGKLHRMAKAHSILKMWQGGQNLHATQKDSHAQNKQMTAIGYISDVEVIVIASWSLLQHDGAAAFKLSE